jgi:2-polyprenyl-3-methyl-5-hydroxy-6-metoxy-1,4-benzoquinol methylase
MTRDSNDSSKGDETKKTADSGAYFGQAAATWDDKPQRVEMAGIVAEAMRNDVPLRPDMKVMDFGCGTGLITRQLAPTVASVTAADTSAEMLAVLAQKAKASGLTNVQTLLLEPGYPSPAGSAYDAIVSNMVFHHIEDISHVLARFAAWLRPGGWVAISDLEPENGTFHADDRHVFHHGIDPSWLTAQMEAVGFTVHTVHIVHTVHKPLEGTTQMREYPIFLLAAQKTH